MLENAFQTGWMQTFTGKPFYPARPRVEDVYIEDIAGALARQCRYAGHCLRFYSVAEHCCHVHDLAPAKYQLVALLHDASEAYLVDIPRPLKPLLGGYAQLEHDLMNVIAAKYGFGWPMPVEVKDIDNAILGDERDQNMAPMAVPDELWGSNKPRTGVKLRCWLPEKAQHEFLFRFRGHVPS